jgi:hypothetical protein
VRLKHDRRVALVASGVLLLFALNACLFEPPGKNKVEGNGDGTGTSWTWRNVPSPDGAEPFQDYSLQAVAWSGSLFVAVGNFGGILTSPDGATWQARHSGTTVNLLGVAWSGSQFVAVGGKSTILTSSDGVSWTLRDSGQAGFETLEAVAWSGSRFVAVGPLNIFPARSHAILTSSDGVMWTRHEVTAEGMGGQLKDVKWADTQFVAVGYDGEDDEGVVLTSPDGLEWTRRARGQLDGASLQAVTWSGTQLVAVGWSEAIFVSPDGIDWTRKHVSGAPAGYQEGLYGIAWSGHSFVAVGDAGTILTSPDGDIWTARPLKTADSSPTLRNVLWSGTRFVAVGRGQPSDGGEIPRVVLTSP